LDLLDAVASLASPTGQWPEAVHPATRGGCMGDGQHAWASAEWVMMIRHLFIREEGERLILGQGIPQRWTGGGQLLEFGPTPTRFGPIKLRLSARRGNSRDLRWQAAWYRDAPPIDVRIPGYYPQTAPLGRHCMVLRPIGGL
jgi:hypothetical protein